MRFVTIRSSVRGALAVAVVTASLLSLTATARADVPQGGFSMRPANFDSADPATRAYFKQTAVPGESFVEQVVLTNSGPTTADFFLYGVDGLTATTSGAVYSNRQDPVRKAGAWVKTSTSRVSVAPGSEQTVGFTVQIPVDATPGDHLAGIAAEDANPKASGGRLSVVEVVRDVVGILITVPGPATPHLQLGDIDLKPLPGSHLPSLVVAVGDDGTMLVKPHLAVSVTGPNGYKRTVGRDLDTILPTDTIAFPLPWPDTLSPGSYEVQATATYADRSVTRTEAVTLATTLTHGTPRASKRGLPTWLLASVPLVAAVLLGFVLGTRRRPLQNAGLDVAAAGHSRLRYPRSGSEA